MSLCLQPRSEARRDQESTVGRDPLPTSSWAGAAEVSPVGRKLRVLLDGRMFVGRFAGVSRYVSRLVDHLSRRDDLALSVLCGVEGIDWLSAFPSVRVIESSFSRSDRTALKRLRWEACHLPGILRRADVDLYHATWNTGIPIGCPVPSILTVHDLIPLRDPKRHFYYLHDKLGFRFGTGWSIRRAFRVLTVSDHTLRDVVSHFPSCSRKIQALPNGVDEPNGEDEANDRFALEGCGGGAMGSDTYVLYVGGLGSRKNLDGLFRVMEAYWRRHGSACRLVLTGSSAGLDDVASAALVSARRHGVVEFRGQVSDTELSSLYRGASVFMTLSHDEGFGLPALEAMAHGCPVVVSRRGALPEVVGDAGCVVEPDAVDDVAGVLGRLLGDDEGRCALSRRGLERAASFSWSSVGARLAAVYAEVAQEARLRARFRGCRG